MGMHILPQLKHCCCGCKLQTGSEFCGWWGAIYGTVTFFLFSTLGGFYAIIRFTLTNEDASIIIVFIVFATIMTLLRILFSIMFLIGIYQVKENNRLPWLIMCNTVYLAGYICFLIMQLYLNGTYIHILVPFIAIIAMCVECYFILVMNSNYWQQKRDEHSDIVQLA